MLLSVLFTIFFTIFFTLFFRFLLGKKGVFIVLLVNYSYSLFLIFYSIFRFLIEFTREPDEHLGLLFLNLSMGQLISILVFFIGILLWQSKKNV